MTTFTTTDTKTTTTDTKTAGVNEKDLLDVTIDEHLSALLDDEVGSFEQKRVLNELSNDDKMRNKLAHYSLIGETLRSGETLSTTGATAGTSFLVGIQDQLASEPEYSDAVLETTRSSSAKTDNREAKNDSSWLRPVGGFAMAASVAALAVIGFQNYIAKPDSDLNLGKPATEIVATNSIQSNATGTSAPVNTKSVEKDSLTQTEMESAIVVPADQLSLSKADTVESATDYAHADLRTRSLLKRYVDSHMQYASTTAFVPSVRVIAYSDF